MREATNPEDVVRSRLWSVLAETENSTGDRTGARPSAAAPPGWPTGDEGALSWNDLIPGWPDDIDLDGDEAASPPGVSWPAPSPAGAATDSAALGSVPPGSVSVSAGPAAPRRASPAGASDATAWAAPGVAPPLFDADSLVEPRSSLAAGGYQPEDDPDPAYEWRYEGEVEPPRGGAGALGRLRQGYPEPGDDERVTPGAARRIGLGAFDPGRRGVRALAVVAVIVVLIAAVLAWRARPRVDPVPPVPATVDSPATADGMAAGAVSTAKTSAGGEVVVAVGGKVKKPGLIRLPAGSRVADALQAAGGADPGVDVALLNLARKVVDGELILVGTTPPPGAVVATGAAGAPAAGAPQGPVNLNTATLADLDTLPGVGPVLAQRILDARAAQGGFTSVGDLRKVDGIGDSRYEQLKDLVTV